jgi:HlyD family secretion protein
MVGARVRSLTAGHASLIGSSVQQVMSSEGPINSVRNAGLSSQPSQWIRHRLVRVLAVLSVVLAIAAVAMRRVNTASATKSVAVPAVIDVGCLGRIEPKDGVMLLGARSLSGQPSLVGKLLVKEGDAIVPGQVVAFLNSKDELDAQWHEAETNVLLAERRLEQVKAGAKLGDLNAQDAEIARLKAELANAKTENGRREALFKNRITSQADVDASRTQLESASQQLRQAQERFHSLAEVRRVDVQVAEAEVLTARAEASRARAAYEASIIRSRTRDQSPFLAGRRSGHGRNHGNRPHRRDVRLRGSA